MAEERYPLDSLARLPNFHHPATGPDGERVGVYYDGTGRNELHVVDATTGEMTQVSNGEVPRNARWPLTWAPDGERLYFHLDESGNEQNDIHELTLEGTSRPVVELDGQTILADISSDGRYLYVVSDAGEQLNLYRYDGEAGSDGEIEQLTSYRRPVNGCSVSPDGEQIAYVTNERDPLTNKDVYVAGSDASDSRRLDIGQEGAEAGVIDWLPDGSGLLVSDNTTDTTRCGIYDLDEDEVSWYGTEGDFEEEPIAVLPGGGAFLANRTRDAAVVPLLYDIETGEERELDVPTGVATFPGYRDAAVLDGDRVVLTQTTTSQRPALVVYDRSTDELSTLIEPEYGDIDPDQFVEADFFTFESHDGTEIEALLYDTGRRPSPAIVKVHGGPPAQDQREFDIYSQFLCSQGYSVLEVNYRGSTGRGREFKHSLIGDWGGPEQADVAEGAKLLMEKDWVNEDRVGVFGGSYGGYSAYMQLFKYPDLYDAGVSWIGPVDLHTMYENSMPHFKTELLEKYMGDPEENYDAWREASPIEHAENLESPLMIVHGVNDQRVPIGQARQLREKLLELGFEEGEDGDFEYEELGEEGHGSTDIQQKIRAFELVADFFERRL